ncbi:Hypothetical protein FSTVST1_173 [Faustovirus ST1]|nr:Hypothetical protein FSTVST1_173 [Faustovirus ST1]
MPFEAKPTSDAITHPHAINAINTKADQEVFGYGVYNHNVVGFGIDFAAMYPVYINIFGGYNQEDSADFKPLIPLRSIMPRVETSLLLDNEFKYWDINHGMRQNVPKLINAQAVVVTPKRNIKPAKRRNAPKRHQNNPKAIRGGSAKPGKFKAKFR